MVNTGILVTDNLREIKRGTWRKRWYPSLPHSNSFVLLGSSCPPWHHLQFPGIGLKESFQTPRVKGLSTPTTGDSRVSNLERGFDFLSKERVRIRGVTPVERSKVVVKLPDRVRLRGTPKSNFGNTLTQCQVDGSRWRRRRRVHDDDSCRKTVERRTDNGSLWDERLLGFFPYVSERPLTNSIVVPFVLFCF